MHISSGPTTVSHLPFPYSVVLYAHTALNIAIGVDHGNILASIGALYVFLYRFRYIYQCITDLALLNLVFCP